MQPSEAQRQQSFLVRTIKRKLKKIQYRTHLMASSPSRPPKKA